MTIKHSRQDFKATFPSLVQHIIAQTKEYDVPDSMIKWLEKVTHLTEPVYYR